MYTQTRPSAGFLIGAAGLENRKLKFAGSVSSAAKLPDSKPGLLGSNPSRPATFWYPNPFFVIPLPMADEDWKLANRDKMRSYRLKHYYKKKEHYLEYARAKRREIREEKARLKALRGPVKRPSKPATEKQRESRKSWYRSVVKKRRADWLKANGPCVQCGSLNDLEVDHIDPATKIHHGVWSWREDRRIAELAKCQVLCSKCHLKKTIAYRKEINPSAKRRKVGEPGTAWCGRCKSFLPIDRFTKNKSNWNGCDSHCRDCRSKRRPPRPKSGNSHGSVVQMARTPHS